MAGHWIEWEKGLVRKPEVIRTARLLASTPQHAAACCMQVWEWAEDVTEDGIVEGVGPADVSAAVGVPGIGEAMVDVGWIIRTGEGLVFPNWDRHNGQPAKRRAISALRMRNVRQRRRLQGLQGEKE